MRVLLISPLPPPAGGIASWTKRYMESNFVKDHEVDVVNVAVKGNRAEKFTAKKKLTEELSRLRDSYVDLEKKLKNNKYDVVHLNSACSKTGLIRDVLFAYAVKRSKTKLLVHFRCDITYMVNNNLSEFLFKKLVKLSDCILTLNSVSKNYVEEKCRKKSIVVPNFVSDDYKNINKISINKNINRVLFVGHVTKAKGCDLICRIAHKFPETEFVLVGHISEEIKSMEKPDNVILKGEMPGTQIKSEYLNSDVLLFPTHTEGFPNVLSEAMACGLPAVATAVGAIPDMLEDKGGIIIGINNDEECIEALNKMSEEKRTQMSEFNYQKVNNAYTIDGVLSRIFEIYSDI